MCSAIRVSLRCISVAGMNRRILMLSISNVSVNYGESRILKDVSMEGPDGKIVCLMGRNGVGKTTLLKTIMGNLKVRKGTIIYEYVDITKVATHRRAQMGIG